MKRSQITAEALAAWTIDALRRGERSLSRLELPDLDVRTFLNAFANADGLPSEISLALVGFGSDKDALQKLAAKAGAANFTHFAADLHEAAAWRNDRARHPVIVAYARGAVTGVNTLRHFEQVTSRQLTVAALRWAGAQTTFTSTPAHKLLLNALQGMVENDDTFSFEYIRAYLEAWSEIGSKAGANAPRQSLPALGLLPDPNLFADSTQMRERLDRNLRLIAILRDRSAGRMDADRRRLESAAKRAKGKTDTRALLKTFDKLMLIRRNPSPENLGAVTLDEALRVFAPAKPDPSPVEDEDDEDDTDTDTRALNERQLKRAATAALLEDRADELAKNAAALSQALRAVLDQDAESSEDNTWECEIDVGEDKRAFKGHLDRPFVSWVRHFCKANVWGGLIETNLPELKRALADFNGPKTFVLDPENLVRPHGDVLGLTKLFAGWDEDLQAQGRSVTLLAFWERMKALRSQLLDSLEELTHFPLEWFSGKPDVTGVAEEYLKISGQIFHLAAQHYGAMSQQDPTWAKTTLEGLLALDVVQAKVELPDGRVTFKAVLLPTHPLHLWRYWRLSRILRGLGKELSEADKSAVIQEASEPIGFLSVIYASPLPDARGAGQILPVANDLYQLATFENLRNAYNGPDGQEALVYAIERFAASHRQHIAPLRLLLVNPPQAGALVLSLINKLLDGRKRNTVSRLRVEVRGTLLQASRLREALLFDTREREIIEEQVAAGKLELIVDRSPKPLNEILAELETRPAHFVAVFDEAPVRIRRGGAGQQLPMSPFCVRRKVAFYHRWNELRLEPIAGDPPFFEFIELIKQVEGNEGEGTPYAWPEAEALRKSVDGVLMPDEFGAHWFFLADRALPEEGEMRAQRLLRRREGQRQVLLAARDYEPLVRLMQPTFESDLPNLLMRTERLQELLAEGAHLIGAGLLDIVKSQEGRVVPTAVVGLMGTLLVQRNHLRRYPNALIVSTDSQLARTWLRLGTQRERSDLFALREEGGRLIIECIEVKATRGEPRSIDEPVIAGAINQVFATVKALRQGLGDTANAEKSGNYLAAPRNEMLKEVLVQGCMGRFASKEDRKRWAGWLERLFGPAPELPEVRGIVADVALNSAEELRADESKSDGISIRLEHFNEIDVQRLLEPYSASTAQANAVTASPSSTQEDDVVASVRERLPFSAPSSLLEAESKSIEIRTSETVADSAKKANAPQAQQQRDWPPRENVFGLIGQYAAATKLHNKVNLVRGTGRRFTDTLFIGPAGVGKSSLARAVAKQLLDEEPIFFSGSDLPKPAALIDKLRERGKIPRTQRGRIRIGRSLIFIDEVHALAKLTSIALLSAMDDARVATVGGTEFDFGEVVFIAATTDKGLLTDAFVSRMDIIPLAAYSLQELAGIIWHHGKRLFDGFELPREVCLEVAARNRCNPRRAVRSLENDLLAEFYNRLPAQKHKKRSQERAAAALMTKEAVADYYESHAVDLNGLDELARNALSYLKQHGQTPEDRLSQGLRISNRPDFVELIEYLSRLGLVTTSHTGRSLTSLGRRYLDHPEDLRSRI
jgi:Holliday junction resolvasome RuvABC ATP-dependent DNA helicase subunit